MGAWGEGDDRGHQEKTIPYSSGRLPEDEPTNEAALGRSPHCPGVGHGGFSAVRLEGRSPAEGAAQSGRENALRVSAFISTKFEFGLIMSDLTIRLACWMRNLKLSLTHLIRRRYCRCFSSSSCPRVSYCKLLPDDGV